MVVFLVVGIVGAAILLMSVFLDGLFDGLFDALDFGAGFITGPVVGAFLAAFGFVAALASNAGMAGGPASLTGLGGGVLVGAVAAMITRSLIQMPTDATPNERDYVGVLGTVVTPIPEGGLGEISVSIAGQPTKLSARADRALPSGAQVRVVSALSPTSVLVSSVS